MSNIGSDPLDRCTKSGKGIGNSKINFTGVCFGTLKSAILVIYEVQHPQTFYSISEKLKVLIPSKEFKQQCSDCVLVLREVRKPRSELTLR